MILALQIAVSIILIILVIIQERASGISGVFGGQGATPYQTRRGLEKTIFYATIVFAVIFAALAIANLL
ncbi:preprotein translocase subunit SecG [Patescibacteria group bacterium]|jgi:preprotein translocase subunit SecG|nr:preprotein translocase subunit SecG [Patescibacteria group bacterium]MCL5114313.1 preprotein translocase subunit SecG [Patescibacteria group bacterium]